MPHGSPPVPIPRAGGAPPAGLPRLTLLNAAIQQSHDAIVITTADLGAPGPTIVFVNPAFCAMTGYAAEELLGRSPRLLQGPETDRAVLDALRDALIAGRAWVGEAVNYRKDGRSYRVEWQVALVRTGAPLAEGGTHGAAGPAADGAVADGTADQATAHAGASGPVTHFIAVQNDVTHRRALEARVRTTNTLEALGRLAGGVAHDFNNLLTVIATGTELALATLGADHPARVDLADVTTAVRRAAALTRQLLAFGRNQAVAPTAVDLNTAVRALEAMLGQLVGPEVALVLALAPEAGSVRVDPSQLDQVIVNLVTNARDAMPAGGLITIATSLASDSARPDVAGPVDGDRRWTVDADRDTGLLGGAAGVRAARADDPLAADPRAAAPRAVPAPPAVSADSALAGGDGPDPRPGFVRLTVGDTGVGMDATTRARAFEPFFTTKPVGHGTGLGLATVYGVVAQHGGQVEVQSVPGRGTTVDVYLPRLSDDDAGAATPPSGDAPEESVGGTETLLLVEDERLVRAATQRLLELRGYTVLAARHGEDALRLYAAHGGAAGGIALVLTDVAMPAMDGPTLVRHLRAAYPRQRVVYVSGYADAAAANGVGVTRDARTAVVEKPFVASALARVVRELLDRSPSAPSSGAPA